ncbi:unnamed protein product [Sphagnum tenellum]
MATSREGEVRLLRLSTFILEVVAKRRLPKDVQGKVLMKLDIEGSEIEHGPNHTYYNDTVLLHLTLPLPVHSMASEITNKPLRLLMECFQPNTWFRSSSLGNGTEWFGEGPFFFRQFERKFTPYELVTEFSPSNETVPTMHPGHFRWQGRCCARILCRPAGQDSFVDDVVKASKVFPALKPRAIYYREPIDAAFYETMFQHVYAGSHVMIDETEDFSVKHSMLSNDMRCILPMSKFRFSKDALSTLKISWLYRKGLETAELIDTKLMWLQAFGLMGRLRNKGGIKSNQIMSSECPEIPWVTEESQAMRCPANSHGVIDPLAMEHMTNLFVVLAAGVGISVVAFVGEVVAHQIREYQRLKLRLLTSEQ